MGKQYSVPSVAAARFSSVRRFSLSVREPHEKPGYNIEFSCVNKKTFVATVSAWVVTWITVWYFYSCQSKQPRSGVKHCEVWFPVLLVILIIFPLAWAMWHCNSHKTIVISFS